MPSPILSIDGLIHVNKDKKRNDTFTVKVVQPIEFYAGSFTTILGPSGCGKTTLLTLLGLLRKPSDSNAIERFQLGEHDIAGLWKNGNERQIVTLRRKHIGFAFQSGELLPSLTVYENIAVPMRLNGIPRKKREERLKELLAAFKLDAKKHNRIHNLSGGEFQRTVLARAIAHSPNMIFVDEPTSALNRDLAKDVLKQLKCLTASDSKSTVVMITHDEALANEFSDQVITMKPHGNTGVIDKVEKVECKTPQ